MKHLFKIFAVSIVALLSGCGGGGGGGGASTPTTYPLKSGYTKRVTNGHTANYAITADCTGTATFIRDPAGSGMFMGASAVTVSGTDTFSTTCPSYSGTTSSTAYFNSAYQYLGTDIPANTYYTGMVSPLMSVPDTVKVGDSGSLGKEIIYTNSDRNLYRGEITGRYVVEPDTATTAIVNEIVEIYDYKPNPELVSTRQERFRIDVNGNITPISIDSQSNPPGEHLVYTYKP